MKRSNQTWQQFVVVPAAFPKPQFSVRHSADRRCQPLFSFHYRRTTSLVDLRAKTMDNFRRIIFGTQELISFVLTGFIFLALKLQSLRSSSIALFNFLQSHWFIWANSNLTREEEGILRNSGKLCVSVT